MRPSYYDLIAALRTLRNHALRSSVDGRPCAPEAIAEATEVLRAAVAEPVAIDSDAAFDALLVDIGVMLVVERARKCAGE